MLCTFDYREKYRFNTTNGLIYENATYIAPRFRLFLIEVSRHVAHKSFAHFDQKKVERQYKVQFQPGTVRKDRLRKEQMCMPKSKRKRYTYSTTTDEDDEKESEESAGEPAAKEQPKDKKPKRVSKRLQAKRAKISDESDSDAGLRGASADEEPDRLVIDIPDDE